MDRIPAGCESVNPDLKRLAGLAEPSDVPELSQWYEHVNYRDSRVEVFAASVNRGETYTYTYELRYGFCFYLFERTHFYFLLFNH